MSTTLFSLLDLRSFEPSDADWVRLGTEAKALEPVEKGFDIRPQLKAFDTLCPEEQLAFQTFWQSLESCDYRLAWWVISKLYMSPLLANESLGLVALAASFIATKPTALSSITAAATPIRALQGDDWAFFVAIARAKLRAYQPAQALSWADLAQEVPHHHQAMVKKLHSDIAIAIRRGTSPNEDHQKLIDFKLKLLASNILSVLITHFTRF